MPGVLVECQNLFETQDFYEILGTQKTASDKELRKAYHKVSLKVHPDRVGRKEKKLATQKFQILGKVYAVLSDKDKRALYDESGEVDDEDDIIQDRNWIEYWRLLFKKITISDINKFEETYKNSEEELDDLTEAYLEGNGNMDFIMETVLCATLHDEDRFTKILNDLIKKKKIPKYDAFVKESKVKKAKRIKKASIEAAEVEELKKELGLGSTDESLKQMITSRNKKRQAEMDSFLDTLAEKYSNNSKRKAKKK